MCGLSSLMVKYFHTAEPDILSLLPESLCTESSVDDVTGYRSLVSVFGIGVFLRVRVRVHELSIGPDTDTSIGIGASLIIIRSPFYVTGERNLSGSFFHKLAEKGLIFFYWVVFVHVFWVNALGT